VLDREPGELQEVVAGVAERAGHDRELRLEGGDDAVETMNVYGYLFQDKQEKLTNDLDALVERTRQPGRPDPSTVAITRTK
jgi:hypothetical protein